MELEELKRKWELLSARLDSEQVVRRQDMERMLKIHAGTYLRYVQFMLLLCVALIPVIVAIGKFRGVPDAVIGWLLGGALLCLLPSFYALLLLVKIARCEVDIVEQERRMIRYTVFVRGYSVFQYVVVVLFVAGMLLWWADYYTTHGMWWTVTALLSLAIIVAVAATSYEWGRIRDLQQRIRELRDFLEA